MSEQCLGELYSPGCRREKQLSAASHETVFHQKYTWVPHEKQLSFYVTKLDVYAVSFKNRSYRVNKNLFSNQPQLKVLLIK